MRINVHAGHNPDGKIACGAVGFIKESTQARQVVAYLIQYLQAAGHTVYNCTVDNGTGQQDVLRKIVAKCNAHTVDVDVSIHFNSASGDKKGDGKTTGTEVWVYTEKSSQKDRAARICQEIAKLGYRNRGVKYSSSLYVLKHTTAPALLIECCFVDDKDDTEIYDAKKMAKAIAQGITGKAVATEAAEPEKPSAAKKPAASSSTSSSSNFRVRVSIDNLNIRTGPGTDHAKTGKQTGKGVFTIVQTSSGAGSKKGWGKLKSEAGWISLDYAEKL